MDEHAWTEAFEGFTSLARDEDLPGEDLERLGEAAWWSARPKESRDAFERAYAAYVAELNPRHAAFVALRLANDSVESRDLALWNGWVRRATTLLEGEPESVEHGYLELALVSGAVQLGRGSIEEAMEHIAAVHRIGTRFGDRDLQAYGLALQGMILVHSRAGRAGAVARGRGGRRRGRGGAHAVHRRLDLLPDDRRLPNRRGLPSGGRVDGRGHALVRAAVRHGVPRRLPRPPGRDHAAPRSLLGRRGRGPPGARRI